jgi:hypothetical protein
MRFGLKKVFASLVGAFLLTSCALDKHTDEALNGGEGANLPEEDQEISTVMPTLDNQGLDYTYEKPFSPIVEITEGDYLPYSDGNTSYPNNLIEPILNHEIVEELEKNPGLTGFGLTGSTLAERMTSFKEDRRRVLDVLFNTGEGNEKLLGLAEQAALSPDPKIYEGMIVEGLINHMNRIKQVYPLEEFLEEAAVKQAHLLESFGNMVTSHVDKKELSVRVNGAIEEQYEDLVSINFREDISDLFDMDNMGGGISIISEVQSMSILESLFAPKTGLGNSSSEVEKYISDIVSNEVKDYVLKLLKEEKENPEFAI